MKEKIKKDKTTEESIKKDPYTIRKLVGRWVLALFFVLLVFPFLADFLEPFLGLPANLTYPFVSTVYFFYMVIWTVRFLLKRKRFTKD